jgi:hypothetical protein
MRQATINIINGNKDLYTLDPPGDYGSMTPKCMQPAMATHAQLAPSAPELYRSLRRAKVMACTMSAWSRDSRHLRAAGADQP